MKSANISMLVMKKGLSLSTGDGVTYNAHGYGLSRWEGGGGVKVELPDQESLTGDSNNTITLGFTSYTNLGSMMSDNKTGIIRSVVGTDDMMVNILLLGALCCLSMLWKVSLRPRRGPSP